MDIEKCPVAEMEEPIQAKNIEYAVAPDGTVGKADEIKQDMPEIQEKMQ